MRIGYRMIKAKICSSVTIKAVELPTNQAKSKHEACQKWYLSTTTVNVPPALITHDTSSQDLSPVPWLLFPPTVCPLPLPLSFFSLTYRAINTIATTRTTNNNIPRINLTFEGLRVSVTRLLVDAPPWCISTLVMVRLISWDLYKECVKAVQLKCA